MSYDSGVRHRVVIALAIAFSMTASGLALVSCDLSYLGPGCSTTGCADGSHGPDSMTRDSGSDVPERADVVADARTKPDADAVADAPSSPDADGASYAATIAAAGPIAWYRFEEEGGTLLVDSSGNGHDGTYHGGPGVSFGRPGIGGGHSAFFNGNGYALVPSGDSGVLDFTGKASFSTEIWADTTVVPNVVGGETLFAKEISADGGSADIGWDLFYDNSNNEPDFQREEGVTDEDDVEPIAPAIVKDEWFHIVVTYDGTHLILYLNGSQADQIFGTAEIPASNVALAIASDLPDSPGGDYTGYLDEFAIYDRPLSSTEVMTHYMLGKP
jgi:hypothetical protein